MAMRKEYEAWAISRGWSVEMVSGFYDDPRTHDGWSSWQASRAAGAGSAFMLLGDLLSDLQGQYPSARISEIQYLLAAPAEDVRAVVEEPVGYAWIRDLEKVSRRNVIFERINKC